MPFALQVRKQELHEKRQLLSDMMFAVRQEYLGLRFEEQQIKQLCGSSSTSLAFPSTDDRDSSAERLPLALPPVPGNSSQEHFSPSQGKLLS